MAGCNPRFPFLTPLISGVFLDLYAFQRWIFRIQSRSSPTKHAIKTQMRYKFRERFRQQPRDDLPSVSPYGLFILSQNACRWHSNVGISKTMRHDKSQTSKLPPYFSGLCSMNHVRLKMNSGFSGFHVQIVNVVYLVSMQGKRLVIRDTKSYVTYFLVCWNHVITAHWLLLACFFYTHL